MLECRRWQSLDRRLGDEQREEESPEVPTVTPDDAANNFLGYRFSTAQWGSRPGGGRVRCFKKYATEDNIHPRRVLLVVVAEVWRPVGQ